VLTVPFANVIEWVVTDYCTASEHREEH